MAKIKRKRKLAIPSIEEYEEQLEFSYSGSWEECKMYNHFANQFSSS